MDGSMAGWLLLILFNHGRKNVQMDNEHAFCKSSHELGQCLLTLKNPHLQKGKNYLDTNIGVFMKINHSANEPCPYYWQSFEILPS